MKKIIIDDENFKTEYSTKICQSVAQHSKEG